MEPKIHVTVKNRENVFFDGDVSAVTSFNDVGIFDILPRHENFISLIKDKIILHKGEAQREIKINQGVLKAINNKVSIYLDL
ncbi:MAG: hypothetical protein HYW63_04855 [Candidatus Levybacteria bacterium]|nr:hypothetical protein [Candidatus Levybacteria bacterium]